MQINSILMKNFNKKIDGIIDSGDGYIKFFDGTMICYGSITTQNNSYVSLIFPKAFISIPSLTLTCVTSDDTFVKVAVAKNLEKTGVAVACMYARLGQSFEAFGGEFVKYIAVGKWK